jgi:hypothetical protein
MKKLMLVVLLFSGCTFAVREPGVVVEPGIVVEPYFYSVGPCYGCEYGFWGGRWGYHRGGGYRHGGGGRGRHHR